MEVAVQEVSKVQLVHKQVIQQLLLLQPTQPHHFHQTTKPQEVVTTIPKLKMTSQLDHQEQLDTHQHHVHQLEQDLQDLKLELEPEPLIQVHKDPQVELHIQAHRAHQLVVLPTQLLANLKDQLDLLPLNAQLQLLSHSKDLELLHRDQAQVVLEDQELKVEAAVEDHHHRANKMKAKKEITRPFPENQTLTIQSTLKFQKLHSIATSKNSQDITLMLKPVAKFSIFAL